jgi:hypothetical protein
MGPRSEPESARESEGRAWPGKALPVDDPRVLAIEATGLAKRYGGALGRRGEEALRGVDLACDAGFAGCGARQPASGEAP